MFSRFKNNTPAGNPAAATTIAPAEKSASSMRPTIAAPQRNPAEAMAASPCLAFRSWKSRTARMAPEAPIGCPRASAPPLWLTIAGS